MDNVVTINHTKEQTLELDVAVQGISTEDIRVWFNVSVDGMQVSFECAHESRDKWTCVVPPLPFLQRTAYPCSVCVVADGYYFEPLNGTLNVVGDAEVYTTAPKNVTFAPAKKSEPKTDKKDEDKKESDVKVTTEAKRSAPPIKKKSVIAADNDKVAAVLANLGIKTREKLKEEADKLPPKKQPVKEAAPAPAAKESKESKTPAPATAKKAEPAPKPIVENKKPEPTPVEPVKKVDSKDKAALVAEAVKSVTQNRRRPTPPPAGKQVVGKKVLGKKPDEAQPLTEQAQPAPEPKKADSKKDGAVKDALRGLESKKSDDNNQQPAKPAAFVKKTVH